MRRDLLQALSKRLREPMPEGFVFDMGLWVNGCGTAGCAAYVASQVPEIRAAGFSFHIHRRCPVFRDAGEMHLQFAALAKVFDIDRRESVHIFDSNAYSHEHADGSENPVTPERVADRIDEFLAANPEGE